jgi:hypothetical protein
MHQSLEIVCPVNAMGHCIALFLVELVENPLVWKKTSDRPEIMEPLMIFNICVIELPVIVCGKVE